MELRTLEPSANKKARAALLDQMKDKRKGTEIHYKNSTHMMFMQFFFLLLLPYSAGAAPSVVTPTKLIKSAPTQKKK